MTKFVFDKTKLHSGKEIQDQLSADFPMLDARSVGGSINWFITANNIPAMNGKKRNRLFTSSDCQRIYNHFYAKYALKYGEPSTTPNTLLKTECPNVRIRDFDTASELVRRSVGQYVAKVQIVEKALKEYFENHPYDEFEAKISTMTVEEWVLWARMNRDKIERLL